MSSRSELKLNTACRNVPIPDIQILRCMYADGWILLTKDGHVSISFMKMNETR